MSKPPVSASQKTKPSSAGGKKDSKKQAEEDQQTVAPPPPPPPVTPFELLPEVWSLSSLHQQRARISVLFGLADCPAGCLCFARVALDDTFQHLRLASTLSLSPAQARFVHQLVSLLLASFQLPDAQWSPAALRDKVQLLLATNCTQLLPGTTYIDTTHLLPALDLSAIAAPPTAASDAPSSAAASAASSTPASSRPETANGKKPPASTKLKPAAPPSPQQQPLKANKPLTAKEKEAAAAAERAVVAAEAAAAEMAAAALAALPPAPLTPPPHFLTAEQMERVWRYVTDRLLTHSEMYRSVYRAEARRRRADDRAEYVWQAMKQQPESNWLRPLSDALSEQPIVVPPAAVEEQPAKVVDCDLTLQDGEYSATEREYLLQVKGALEQQLRDAVQQQQRQQQTQHGKAELEQKEQYSSEPNVARVIMAK